MNPNDLLEGMDVDWLMALFQVKNREALLAHWSDEKMTHQSLKELLRIRLGPLGVRQFLQRFGQDSDSGLIETLSPLSIENLNAAIDQAGPNNQLKFMGLPIGQRLHAIHGEGVDEGKESMNDFSHLCYHIGTHRLKTLFGLGENADLEWFLDRPWAPRLLSRNFRNRWR